MYVVEIVIILMNKWTVLDFLSYSHCVGRIQSTFMSIKLVFTLASATKLMHVLRNNSFPPILNYSGKNQVEMSSHG